MHGPLMIFLRHVSLSLIALLPLLLLTCAHAPEQPGDGSIHVDVEAVTCTQAWLRIRIQGQGPLTTLSLFRNGEERKVFKPSGSDTVIIDEGLRPASPYAYTIRGNVIPGYREISATLNLATLDTTSHDFVWQMITIGGELGAGPSHLRDVAIGDATHAYAGGAIYLLDSAGRGDTDAYNVITWDGSTWMPLRAWFSTICGRSDTSSYPVKSVYLPRDGAPWLLAGNQVLHWSQPNKSNPECVSSPLSTLWGSGSSSIFGVGYSGSIIHFDGQTWTALPSPTLLYLYDVAGTSDDQHIWVCGWADNYSSSILTVLEGSRWRTVWNWSGSPRAPFGSLVTSVSVSGKCLFVASDGGVFQMSATGRTDARYALGSFPSFIYRIRAAAPNDIIVVGDRAAIWHFNGLTWKQMNAGPQGMPLYSADIKGNVAIAVGTDLRTIVSPAVIFVGRR
jgi:hypothetical protein